MYHAVISGTGAYLPEKKLTNFDLEQMVTTSNEWIVTRTGISERRIAGPSQATSDLALFAAEASLKDAGLCASDLDMIIVATETPDHPFPPVACKLQHSLGCRQIAAFDLHMVCTGFVAALHTAESFIKLGRYRHILVVGADVLSRITDYSDRSTCILFGDGAGAFIVSQGQAPGIIHSAIHSDGEHFEAAIVPGGGSRFSHAEEQPKTKIVMDGNKIFKLAVQSMCQTVKETLDVCHYTLEDIDWIIPHQANQRIIDAIARNLNVSDEKMISTIRNFGNNSAATIPIAMNTAIRDGRIRRGDKIVLTAFGGGLGWGSLLLKY